MTPEQEAAAACVSPGPNGAGAEASHGPDYTVIVTCFDEDQSLRAFHEGLGTTLAGIDRRIDIVYVNDGSSDSTLEILLDLVEQDSRIAAVVDLMRNVGQTNAMTAGICQATGRDIVFLDCDLQLDPSDLGAFIECFETGLDLVSGYRASRRDGLYRTVRSALGNWVVSKATGLRVRDLGCNFKVFRGTILRAHNFGPERPLNPGEVILALRSIKELEVRHTARRYGRTRWTSQRRIRLYLGVLRDVVPVVFPIVLVPLILLSVLLTGYIALAAAFPTSVWFPATRPVLAALEAAAVTINLASFFVLGEFILVSRAAAGRLAYVVRNVYERRASPLREVPVAADTQEAAGPAT